MGTTQNQRSPQIDNTRWKIGWNPFMIILPPIVLGAGIGYAVDSAAKNIAIFAAVGLLVGLAIWYWGAQEVNKKYSPLLDNFRDMSQNWVTEETGGIKLNSIYNFFTSAGDSPSLIEPAPTYHITHIFIGDTSVIINKQFQYDMESRTSLRGGEQSELFYDQISNVRSKKYNNRATLELSLSSGQVIEIPSRDPQGVEMVKSELQQYMRTVRR
jgi:hypothetical protein